MKTQKRLIELEKAKNGEKSEVGGLEVFIYDLYKQTLAQIVRLDSEVEALNKRLEKVEAKK